jgi:hypothetical protein
LFLNQEAGKKIMPLPKLASTALAMTSAKWLALG